MAVLLKNILFVCFIAVALSAPVLAEDVHPDSVNNPNQSALDSGESLFNKQTYAGYKSINKAAIKNKEAQLKYQASMAESRRKAQENRMRKYRSYVQLRKQQEKAAAEAEAQAQAQAAQFMYTPPQ
jgi:hypothetical protein